MPEKKEGVTLGDWGRVDDLMKHFDRVTGEYGYKTTGAEHRPPQLQSISAETYKKSQEIVGSFSAGRRGCSPSNRDVARRHQGRCGPRHWNCQGWRCRNHGRGKAHSFLVF